MTQPLKPATAHLKHARTLTTKDNRQGHCFIATVHGGQLKLSAAVQQALMRDPGLPCLECRWGRRLGPSGSAGWARGDARVALPESPEGCHHLSCWGQLWHHEWRHKGGGQTSLGVELVSPNKNNEGSRRWPGNPMSHEDHAEAKGA